MLTVQTAGENLNFHPHLHGGLADGLFAPDGTFTPFKIIDQAKLQQRFGELVLAALLKNELITDEIATQILSQEHTGFSVWLGDAFQDQDSKQFVARYIERGPISLEKLALHEDVVTYTSKDGSVNEFDLLEFLALMSSHIAKPYESLTRYYGFWSCRSRGERRKLELPAAAVTLEPEIPEPKSKPSSEWARCIKQVYEINPLQCPKCKGSMRIISFIQDPNAIAEIADSLGLPPYTAPPPLPLSAASAEPIYINYQDIPEC